jgi:hypothetical protein
MQRPQTSFLFDLDGTHFRKTRHPIIEGYDPPEGWGWCYVDEISLDLVAFWPTGTLSMPAPSTPVILIDFVIVIGP